MKVKELIELLKTFPQDADVQKVSLSDDTGYTDSEMTKEDWGMAEEVIDANGNPSDQKILCCCFSELDEETNEEEDDI